jgi:hypothetical protein
VREHVPKGHQNKEECARSVTFQVATRKDGRELNLQVNIKPATKHCSIKSSRGIFCDLFLMEHSYSQHETRLSQKEIIGDCSTPIGVARQNNPSF